MPERCSTWVVHLLKEHVNPDYLVPQDDLGPFFQPSCRSLPVFIAILLFVFSCSCLCERALGPTALSISLCCQLQQVTQVRKSITRRFRLLHRLSAVFWGSTMGMLFQSELSLMSTKTLQRYLQIIVSLSGK